MWPSALVAVCLVIGVLLAGCGDGSASSRSVTQPPGPGPKGDAGHLVTLRHPIARSNLLEMPFGTRSDWLQPWRAYLRTVPATTLLHSIGINDNIYGGAALPADSALLHRIGFTRARFEVGWDELDDADPSRMAPADLQEFTAKLRSLQRNHIRPLILLNANDEAPTPLKRTTVTVARSAPAGASTLQLSSRDVGAIDAGRTGISLHGDPRAISDLITSISAQGQATLSRPLEKAVPAGPVTATTLLAAPFGPVTVDGRPNPYFQATMRAWLHYVGVITSTAKRALGDENFDVEIWNELSFGSAFIDPRAYWAGASKKDAAPVRAALLRQTVAYLRDPAHGVSRIGIGDGFTDEVPFGSGANQPGGITAIDKHPYAGPKTFPLPASRPLAHSAAVGALGRPASDSPRFTAFLPEWFLTGLQTETLVRDLAPFTTRIGGTPHGRNVHAPGARPPKMWVTEVNLDFKAAARKLGVSLSKQQARWLEAKAVLRYYTSFVNKGVSALYLYALRAGALSVINPAYTGRLKHEAQRAKAASRKTGASPRALPLDLAAAGPSAEAISRLVAAFHGARSIAHPRQLSLESVASFNDDAQFHGTSNPNTPSLYNRDVLAFLPFEVSPRRFVIPVYVMTRDMLAVQRRGLPTSAKTRFDLEPERFRLTIGNVPSCDLALSASDPMHGSSVRVRRVSCHHHRLQVEIPVVDYPRLLTLAVR